MAPLKIRGTSSPDVGQLATPRDRLLLEQLSRMSEEENKVREDTASLITGLLACVIHYGRWRNAHVICSLSLCVFTVEQRLLDIMDFVRIKLRHDRFDASRETVLLIWIFMLAAKVDLRGGPDPAATACSIVTKVSVSSLKGRDGFFSLRICFFPLSIRAALRQTRRCCSLSTW